MLINDTDIDRAERIILKNGQHFDEEHRNFIKCVDMPLHLQACPGSGKTTALVAKLYILSEKMPFEKNQGLCVLTHTNVAIDLIKNKLGEKANRMFSHPNFFGTIQSFVDKYLAIPAYVRRLGYKPNYIDTDLQKELMSRTYYLKGVGNGSMTNLRCLNHANKIFGQYTIQKTGQEYKIIYSSNREEIKIRKPKAKSHKDDWTDDEKREIIKAAIALKIKALEIDRVLSYWDTYDFAKDDLDQIPNICNVFSSRFKYVFIDEAQDTSRLQKEVIEKCFNKTVIIQWIGDINQGIMNDDYTQTAWDPNTDSRYATMRLTKSYRISQPIADVIKNIAVNPYDKLSTCSTISIRPVIIAFDDNTKDRVLEKFAELVCTKTANYDGTEKNLYDISLCSGNPVKAVGWVGKDRESDLSICSYFPNFDKHSTNINKTYFPNLFTMCELSQNISPRVFESRTIYCILEALYLSDMTSSKNRKYSKSEFMALLYDSDKSLLDRLLESIARYYMECDFEEYSKAILNCLGRLKMALNKKSTNYLEEQILKDVPSTQHAVNYNVYKALLNDTEVVIPIDTVHGIKGETHTATLYLETKYYKSSIEYFCKELVSKRDSKESASQRKNQALKIAHVAFSRPTHLLCISMGKSTYKKICNCLSDDVFEVLELFDD